jgi:methyltransferase (TIGR00027 family)
MKQGEASSTAKVIAASTLLLASDPRTASLVAPGAADLCRTLLSTNRSDRLLARSAEWQPTLALWRMLERLTLPGIMAHYWDRKRWIERWCRVGLAQGFRRVVVLGAGFDTLGYRLARENAGIDVVEIDHPATQRCKQQALAAHPGCTPANLRFLACDLARETLPLDHWDARLGTLVVVEGVLMYLRPAEVDQVLRSLCACPARPLRILFSAMARWPDGGSGFRPCSWLIDRWLARRGERFQWSIAPDEVPVFLSERGLRMTALVQPPQLREGTGSRSRLEGENLITCEPLLGPVRHATGRAR